MSRQNRPRQVAPAISTTEWAFLCDAPRPENADVFRWSELARDSEGSALALWRQYGATVLEWWCVERPGTRPSLWWRHDAPEPCRRRLGGVGTPAADRLAYVPRFAYGVPRDWISAALLATYRGLGAPLGVPAVDPDDLPTFEAEATYLDRLGLLTAAERRRLTADDFEPEALGGDW